MRVLVKFMLRDEWHVHCVAADSRTPISPFTVVHDHDALIELLRYIGADDVDIAAAEEHIHRGSHGAVWIDLTPGRKNVLFLQSPYSDSLALW